MKENAHRTTPYTLYLATAILAIFIISGMFYVMERGRHIGSTHSRMIESAEEIIANVSQTHLWLEEKLVKKEESDEDAILGYIDIAGEDNQFIREKGNHKHMFNAHPELASLNDQTAEVKGLLGTFRLLTHRRLEVPNLSGVGTGIDHLYDEVFSNILADVGTMRDTIVLSRDLHLKYFRLTQIILIVVVASLLAVIATMLALRHRYLRALMHSRRALQESEERYRTLFEEAPDMIHVADCNGRIVDVNQTETRRLGYSREELIGKKVTEIIHPACLEASRESLKRVFCGEKTIYDTALITSKGARIDVEVNATPHMEGGECVATRAIIRDITERKKRDDELRHRLAIEGAIAEASKCFSIERNVDLNAVLRALGVGVGANRAYIFQLRDGGRRMDNTHEWCDQETAAQISNLQNLDTSLFPWWMEKMKSNENIIVPSVADLPPEASTASAHLLTQGALSLIVVPLHSQDGALFGFMGLDDTARHRAWSDEDGRALLITGAMILSYMKRREAEDELLKHSFFLNETQKVANLGTYSFDVTTGFWRSSEILDNILGTDDNYAKDVQGWLNIVHPDDRDGMERYLSDNIIGRLEPFSREYRIVRVNDNEIRWVHGLGEHTFDGAGRHVRMVGTIQDITERKEMEETLIKSESQLHALSSHILTLQERERRRLALELHDELGQSLAFLGLQLNNISMKLHDDQQEAKMECEESMDYLDQVIEKTRRLSRDLSPAILEDLGLSLAIHGLIEDMTKHYGAEVRADVEAINNLFTEDRQIGIYRIFQESLTNVIKHAQATEISIVVRKMADSVYFSIEDNGRGYDSVKNRVVDSTGRGMGLFTLKERLRMVNASFEMVSQVGEGTTVAFTVPTDMVAG